MTKTNSSEISQLLVEMNRAGGFLVSVLTDREGFPIASASANGQNSDTQAAVVALAQKTVNQVRDHLGMAGMDEFTLFDEKGQRLVCRPFSVNDRELILAVLSPDKGKAYRRLTNQAVLAIQRMW